MDSFISLSKKFNARYEDGCMILSVDELTTLSEISEIIQTQLDFDTQSSTINHVFETCKDYVWKDIPRRKNNWLEQDVFNKYHSETNMMLSLIHI